MSGLAEVLAGRVGPGAYRWQAAYDVADVRRAAEDAGWRLAHLDGTTATTRAEELEALGRALDLPSWWGRNLDALADCLRDLEGDDGTARTLVLWDGWGSTPADPRRRVVLRLLAGSGMVVLLRGGDADPGLPALPSG